MDDQEDKFPPRGILFVLEDGTPWAELVGQVEPEPELPSNANIIIPDCEWLH